MGGGGGDAPAPVLVQQPAVNLAPIGSLSSRSIGLTGVFDASASSDADGSISSFAWNFGDPASGAANSSSNASATTTHIYSAPGNYTVTVTVTDNQGASSVKQNGLKIKAGPPPTVATGKLNDTGVTSGQCYGAGSDTPTSCTSAAAITLNSTQDGMTGRDSNSASNSNTDGKLGFSFTKIGPDGETLPASATSWDCVKDKVTGLMWEVKTTDGGLRDGTRTYSNLDSTVDHQLAIYVPHHSPERDPPSIPTQDQIDAPNNSVGFKNAVNTAGLCGANDWRLPTREELHGIMDYGVAYPNRRIDVAWFPNSQDSYWTSTPIEMGSMRNTAWIVSFKYDPYLDEYPSLYPVPFLNMVRYRYYHARLVR